MGMQALSETPVKEDPEARALVIEGIRPGGDSPEQAIHFLRCFEAGHVRRAVAELRGKGELWIFINRGSGLHKWAQYQPAAGSPFATGLQTWRG